MLFGLGTDAQLALFALYAVLAVMVGRRFYANRGGDPDGPRLNDPAARLVGRTVVVVEAVDAHQGRVTVGDSEWSARGGPAEAGERVRITGVEGNCLTVERQRELAARLRQGGQVGRSEPPPGFDREQQLARIETKRPVTLAGRRLQQCVDQLVQRLPRSASARNRRTPCRKTRVIVS